MQPEPEQEPEPQPEPDEPEPQPEPAWSAARPFTPVPLVWRETDEISSAESTPMSAMSGASWPQGSVHRANTPVSLVWQDTADISSAENTPVSVRDSASADAPVRLVWRDTEEISSEDEGGVENDTETDDSDDNDEDDGDEDDSDGSDDSWSARQGLLDVDPGNLDARLQAEIDTRVAHELAVTDRSLVMARAVRDLASEVSGIVKQSEQSELLQRVAPSQDVRSPPGEAVWTETATAMAQLCNGLSARVTAAVAYDPVAIARVQKQLVDAGRCALLPGLEDQEIASLERKFRARFPPEMRAFLRCAVPVDPEPASVDATERQSGDGWVNWHLLLHGDRCGGDTTDIVALRRSEWAALLSPDRRAQSLEHPILPIFGKHVIPSVPNRNGLPVWTTNAVDVTVGSDVAPAPAAAASTVGATFWHWLEREQNLENLVSSIPVEWAADAVPVEKVPFWPQELEIDGLVSDRR